MVEIASNGTKQAGDNALVGGDPQAQCLSGDPHRNVSFVAEYGGRYLLPLSSRNYSCFEMRQQRREIDFLLDVLAVLLRRTDGGIYRKSAAP